jgi:hypothetical protein
MNDAIAAQAAERVPAYSRSKNRHTRCSKTAIYHFVYQLQQAENTVFVRLQYFSPNP